MKFSPRNSRHVYICLCLLFSYALLISNIGMMAPRPVSAEQKSESAGKNLLRNNRTGFEKQGNLATPISFLQSTNQARSRDGEVLVKFRAGASEQDKNVVALTHGVQRKKLRGESGVEKLRTSSGQTSESLALALQQQPSVEFAEPNFLIAPDQLAPGNDTTPDDAQFGEQWALKNTGQNAGQFGSDIGATAAWQTTTGSQSTVIAVIDSGVDFTHPDLANNQWTNLRPSPDGDLHGWDYIANNGNIKDEQGHGTAIAGIIAAQGDNSTGISGVMWRASLMSLRVLDNAGTGDIANAVEAIDYAVSHGAQVINISWGTNGQSLVLKDAIERALRRGVVVVCSAGNASQDIEAVPYYPASFGLRDLITVASSDNFDRLASWSNWGTNKVTVAAPGVDVLTTRIGGGYWKVTGTSASAPLVTGVAGLIKSANALLNPTRVAKAISDEARKVASLNGKVSSGGVVSASASLGSLGGSPNLPLPIPTTRYGTGGTGPGGSFSGTPPPQTTGAPGANLPNLDQARNSRPEAPRAREPIQSNLMCADCDPQGGGGGGSYHPAGDPNFSTARELPPNETGQTGVDLGSRNFNWSLPLVGLAGRAGMDLNLTLYYNSLVWTKDGLNIKYNADLGSPAPGFRLGLPVLQQRFLNSQTATYSYMMVTPSGGRVELRQVGSSNIYESEEGSYTQLDVSNASAPLIRTSDGTQLKFASANINNEYRCTEIKDRNGNFISATYNATNGHLETVIDTLGRVITFVYDASNNLQAIRQTWAGVSHDWATFGYVADPIAPAFDGLSVNGPNNINVTVLNQVNLHDGSFFRFDYNTGFGQVKKINHHAPDGHLLSYTEYNVNSAAGQTDCPRFTERRDWAQDWNNSTPALTTYSVAGDDSWSQQVAPDGTIYKELYTTSGWSKGLPHTTEVWSSSVKRKWTTVSWTQDDVGLSYRKNPRVTETNIYDVEGNRKRVTITYGASYSLPNEIVEYAADGTTMLRKTITDYNLNSSYTDRRIIGLVSQVQVLDASSATVSKTTLDYDSGGEFMVATSQQATRHDATNYGAGFVTGRGNLATVLRWDVTDINNATKAIAQRRMGYNSTGSMVFMRDALNHQTSVSYTDAFSDSVNRNAFAYPTTLTDAGGFQSLTKYNFDFGGVTWVQTPAPTGQTAPTQTVSYDAAARIQQVTSGVNGAYTLWLYSSSHTMVETLSTITSTTNRSYSLQHLDGAGRVRSAASDSPGSVGGYSGQYFVYDNMGRVSQQSKPTEMNGGWTPTGDDSVWYFTFQAYDWKGRPTVTTNPDGYTRENTYGGCGCAGGEVTTVRDEAGRRRKLTMDVLGRLKQVDELKWDQTVYATTSYNYNARDQITTSSQSGQFRTFNYDGYGRLSSKTTPEQGTMSYSYFADDAVQTVTDARLASTTFAYNSRHLVTGITFGVPGGVAATPNVSFAYDPAGNRTSMTDGLGSASYNYNSLSQLTSETRVFSVGSFTLNYAYNLGGELTSVTNPWSAQVGYNYDKMGRPTAVTGSGYAGVSSYVNSLGYRAFGVKQMSYANGKTLSINYDNRMRMTRWDVAGVLGSDYEYRWEDTFRPTMARSRTDATLDRWYNYDNVGRLHIARSGGEARAAYGEPGGAADGPYSMGVYYDVWGNITLKEGWGGTNPAYTASYTGNKRSGFTYDAAGNLINDGGQQFTYDATGQQATATYGSLQQYYDGDRLRGKKIDNGTTTYYLRSSVLGGQVIAEINSSGTFTRGYVYLGGQLLAVQQSSAVSWVHQDPVTKSQRVTNSAGAIVSTIELDPWGGETNRSSNEAFQPKKFTSYERDANGSDDAMHRRYSRWHSRFDQPDPYDGSYSLTDPQSFNRYAYVQNDPVNFVDPSGLCPEGTEAQPDARGDMQCVGVGGHSVPINIPGGGRSGGVGGTSSGPMELEDPSPDGPLGGDPGGGAGPQNPITPQDFRRDTFNKFQADIERCIDEIFGKTAKKIPAQTLDNAPQLDVSINGRELAKRSDHAGKVRSVVAISDPNKGKNGTVFIQSGAWNYPNYPLDVLQGAYIHEHGNILSKKYGGDFYKFGDKAGVGEKKDRDTGANFQRCVFPSSVKF